MAILSSDDILYPPIEPYQSGFIDSGDGHQIYFEVSGNPSGQPVLFVHGGPGGGTGPNHRRFFDPAFYKIVLFDQRGCGRSKPHASLEKNTTAHLISDIERIRTSLGVVDWVLFGGSWGSTLALAYTQAHPDAVSALVLRGVFLLRKREIDWFYQEGASRFFPEAWKDFCSVVPFEGRANMISAYSTLLSSKSREARVTAAQAWSRWEKRTSYLEQRPEEIAKVDDEAYSLAFARIENHYFSNNGFFRYENQLLDGLSIMRQKPGIIVQGRYDMVCPPETAFEVAKLWDAAELRMVNDSGHSAFENGIAKELIKATDDFRRV
ncbi:MAG: prolyl aminopeptidase [Gammaproteobacteria bacterium]